MPSAISPVLNEFASDTHSKTVKRPTSPRGIIKTPISLGVFEPDFVQSCRHCTRIITFYDSM